MSAVAGRGLRSTKAFTAVILVVVLLLAWATVRSSIFAVRQILVAGHSSLSRAHVVRLSGLQHGDNLVLDVSADDVRDRLERSPWVAEAEVERRLPSTVILTVRERTPAGWVGHARGGAVVSGDGTVLERSERPPPRLPVLGPVQQAVGAGATVPAMGPVLRVAGSLPAALQRDVAAVRQDGSDIVLRLRAGGRVLYGPPSSLGAKNAAIASMLRWSAERGVRIAYVDVRAPDAPVIRPHDRG